MSAATPPITGGPGAISGRVTRIGQLAQYRPRLLTVGDSEEQGTHTYDANNWSVRDLCFEISLASGGLLLPVRNTGIGGATSGQISSRVLRDAVAFKPDIIVAGMGTNDAGTLASSANINASLMATYVAAQSCSAKLFLRTCPPYPPQSALITTINGLITAFCATYSIPLIDWYNLFNNPASPGTWLPLYSADDTHPIAQREFLAAQLAWQVIQPFVDSTAVVPYAAAADEVGNLFFTQVANTGLPVGTTKGDPLFLAALGSTTHNSITLAQSTSLFTWSGSNSTPTMTGTLAPLAGFIGNAWTLNATPAGATTPGTFVFNFNKTGAASIDVSRFQGRRVRFSLKASTSGFNTDNTPAAMTTLQGTLAFTTNPTNNSTIVVNGPSGATTVTFVTSGATGNQVNIGGSLTVTMASLLALLQGSADANLSAFTWATFVLTSSSNVNLVASCKTYGHTPDGYHITTTVVGGSSNCTTALNFDVSLSGWGFSLVANDTVGNGIFDQQFNDPIDVSQSAIAPTGTIDFSTGWDTFVGFGQPIIGTAFTQYCHNFDLTTPTVISAEFNMPAGASTLVFTGGINFNFGAVSPVTLNIGEFSLIDVGPTVAGQFPDTNAPRPWINFNGALTISTATGWAVETYLGDATSGALAPVLPAVAQMRGRRIKFVKVDSSGNTITPTAASGDTFLGGGTTGTALSSQGAQATYTARSTPGSSTVVWMQD